MSETTTTTNGQPVADQWYAQMAAQREAEFAAAQAAQAQRPQAVQVPPGYVLVPAAQPQPQQPAVQPVAAVQQVDPGAHPQQFRPARRERRERRQPGGPTVFDTARALPGWGKFTLAAGCAALVGIGVSWQVGGYVDRQVAGSVAVAVAASQDNVVLPATAQFVEQRLQERLIEAQSGLTVAVIQDPMSVFKCPPSAAARAIIGTDPADASGQRPNIERATSVAQQVAALQAAPQGIDLRALRIAPPAGADPNPRVTTNPADAQLFACQG
jgi:hypothetical protein